MSLITVERGIRARHADSCRAPDGTCDCAPTFKAEAFDPKAERRIYRTFPTITAARRWRQDAYSALRAGTMSADHGPTLQQAGTAWLAAARAGIARNRSGEPYKPSAVRSYERMLRRHVYEELGHERLRELTLPRLQRHVDKLAGEGLAAATITNAITPIRAIVRRARQLGEVHTNPTSGISLPAVHRRQRRFATVEQVEAMLERLELARDRTLWAIALYAGLRRGELAGLHAADIDLDTGVLRVERGWDNVAGEEIAPKSKQGRRKVPLPVVLREHLEAFLPDATPAGRVFPNVRKAYNAGRAAARDADVEPPTLHECRHGYASLMIAAGVNVKALSTFMGHANIGITLDQYGHLLPGAEDEAAGLLDTYLARY